MLENVLSLCKSSPAYVLALSYIIIVFRNNLSREEWAYRVRICQWQLLSMLTNADHHQTEPDIIFNHAIALSLLFLQGLHKIFKFLTLLFRWQFALAKFKFILETVHNYVCRAFWLTQLVVRRIVERKNPRFHIQVESLVTIQMTWQHFPRVTKSSNEEWGERNVESNRRIHLLQRVLSPSKKNIKS